MIFLHPIWLLLAIPLTIVLWVWRAPTRFLTVLRWLTLFLVVAAMAGVAIRFQSRSGTVVVVVDRSRSMPPHSEVRQKEIIDLLQTKMGQNDRLAVVSMGQTAAIDRVPQKGKFAGFLTSVGPDASRLSGAMKLALSLVPSGGSGRILLLSDGKWTGKDPRAVAAQAAARDISVDFHLLRRPSSQDISITRVQAPGTVAPGEAFLLSAEVHIPTTQTISYVLKRGGQVLGQGTKVMSAGGHRLVFRDKAGKPGTFQYSLTVKGVGKDPVPENNKARILVGIRGQRPLLLVSETPRAGFARLLRYARIPLTVLRPRQVQWSLSHLSRYSGLLLENIEANKIGTQGMETIAAWVKQSGAGLMMTGGSTSFGPGGYFRSPLEAILPVSMELRREHRKLSLAMAIVLDRSGSMGATVAGGQTKMALANLASAQTLNLLSPLDELGVLAVDTKAHTIVPLMQVHQKPTMRERILGIASMGGGIYVYDGLVAAYEMLQPATAKTRHILLFADAADAEQPGKYKSLLALFKKEKITVSVIGLGKDTDPDAAFLKDVAKRGHGRIFFTEDAASLPRLFAQDTFIVVRSTFVKEKTPFQWTTGLAALTDLSYKNPPSTGGYNLCYLRPGATQAALTTDEYKAPIVSFWQVGLGRALAYTAEVDGKHTGALAKWSQLGSFLSTLARWTAGKARPLPRHMLLTQKVRRGVAVVQLHLDPERKNTALSTAPSAYTIKGVSGLRPKVLKTQMKWLSPHVLQVEIPLQGKETSLTTVKVAGYKPVVLPPVTLPYSPEFRPDTARDGPATLASLARISQGKERLDVSQVWRDLPRKVRLFSLRPWLLGLAVLFFLCEIFERRSGYLSRMLRAAQYRWFRVTTGEGKSTDAGSVLSTSTEKPVQRRAPPAHLQPTSKEESADSHGMDSDSGSPVVSGQSEGLASAFQKASRRVKERNKRKND